MDPITVVSLSGIIVQLVDFSIKMVSKSTELYRSGRGVLTENTQIETAIEDLSKLNTQLKQSTAAGDTELQVLCQACSDVANQLLAALAKVKVKGKGQKWQGLGEALRSIWSKEEVQQLEFRLASFRDQLNRCITTGMREEVSTLKEEHAEQFKNIGAVGKAVADAIIQQNDVFAAFYDMQSKIMAQRKKRQVLQNYEYSPLKGKSEFRLLELMPGKGNEPLIGNLLHFDLSLPSRFEIPAYEAISYVWGSSQTSHTIRCSDKILNITTNLKNALCRVRQPQSGILVWADAICIDQSALRERKMQVDLMRLIFAEATMVSICLGGGIDCSIENLIVLKAILQTHIPTMRLTHLALAKRKTPVFYDRLFKPSNPVGLPVIGYTSRDIRSTNFQESSLEVKSSTRTLSKQVLQKLLPPVWRLIAEFFDDPWFSRIWVVQEVAESRNARVLFNNLEIAWQNIVELAKRILRDVHCRVNILQFTRTKGIQNVLVLNNKISTSSHDPIPILLQSTRDFGASDPRDKVYAVLHRPFRKPRAYSEVQFLQGRKYGQFITQSFSMLYLLSIILDHALTDIRFWCLLLSLGSITHHLRFHHSIRMLAFDFYQRFANFLSKLERVVYSRFQVTDTLYNMLGIYADYSLTAPSVYRMVATRLIERTRRLNILSYVNHGATIDVTYPSWVPRWDTPTDGVKVLTALPDHGYRSSAEMEHTLRISSNHADHLIVEGVRFSTISSISEVIRSTQFPQLNANHLSHGNVRAIAFNDHERDNKYPTGESLRRAYIATLTAGRLGHIERESFTHAPSEPQQVVAAALGACYGRRQFVTGNGYLGIGPAAMQRGDIVCILFGGCVPYVLRTMDTDGLYRVMGESYVHGMMQGELIERWRGGGFAKDRFMLC